MFMFLKYLKIFRENLTRRIMNIHSHDEPNENKVGGVSNY